MEAILIEVTRDAYSIEDVAATLTAGQLAEYFAQIAEEYGEDAPVYTSHDNGYTYGGITSYNFKDTAGNEVIFKDLLK